MFIEESGNEAEWEKISPDKVETVPKMDYVKPKNEETPETDAKSEEKQSADTRKRDLPNWMKQNEPSAKGMSKQLHR